MGKKALILYASARPKGEVSVFVNLFKENFKGEIQTQNLFETLSPNSKIYPCLDCGMCSRKSGCAINDGFQNIIGNDADIIVLAAPIYMSNLPAPALALISRFNYLYNNKKHLNIIHDIKPKTGVLILTGGGGACKPLAGQTNEDLPIRQTKYLFKKLNADLQEQNIVLSLKTDTLPTKQDEYNKQKIINIAKSLNKTNYAEKE